ncbi:serine/threonine-protein kinase [uncultured Microbacterium sp.]|uniref:serine/threonine-protein kinase n=1 Tax=uncultured Microbacterium sp. TaxID=191216 RepID=UPI0035CA782C
MAKRLPSAPPILPGLDYVRPLGSGGFADVFLYQQDMPRRSVAVKVLPSDVRDPELLRMFNAEADVLAHLSAHPSIVTVYQAGISADGRPYIVMEYCPGSLAQRYRVERIPLDEVLSIGVRMSGALESAHRAGLVHRDIKPSNILITSFGTPVLADFGISSSLARTPEGEMLAMSVPWSAPEVITEQTTGSVASEVWSLGATVYSLAAGRSPFERRAADGSGGENSREQLRRRIARAVYTPIPRPDLPDALQDVLARAMDRDPRRRHPSAAAFGEELRSVQLAQGIAPSPMEIPVDEWAPASESVDFADTALRGPQRSRIEHESRRRVEPAPAVTSFARDEDAEISGEGRTRSRYWILGGAVAIVVAVAAVVAGLLAGGV